MWEVLSCVFHQITAGEIVAEMKPVGPVESGPTSSTESSVKPPPFKDPTFMVSVCACPLLLKLCLLLLLLPGYLPSCPSRDLWSILGLVVLQLAKRTGPGRTSNSFWLWKGLYPGSSMTPTVSLISLFLLALVHAVHVFALTGAFNPSSYILLIMNHLIEMWCQYLFSNV